MLRLITYDITEARRLQRVANVCEDFGVRVQKSIFECWLEDDAFERLWTQLTALLDPESDCLAAYTLEKSSASQRRTAGEKMHLTHRTRLYLA